MPSIAAAAAAAGGTDTMPLYAFIGSTMTLTTCYGGLLGVFCAVLPVILTPALGI